MKKAKLLGQTAAWVLVAALTSAVADGAAAQTASSTPAASATVPELIVTASKREQAIESVPMSINAATGATLRALQVTSVYDLTAIVPGFTATPSSFGDPVYVIRGVGLYDSGLGSSPDVSVYLDQVPLPYTIMTEVAPIDLQRVEVLKGPQGTLFGENTTGGAINYIAAKPTDQFEAGIDTSYSSFNKGEVDGFVSGPLSDTLTGRLSLGTTQGGAWQQSLTRPGDKLGNTDTLQGRMILDWQPVTKLKVELNLNGFYDGSDTQAPQLELVKPSKPNKAPPALLSSPLATGSATEADWHAGYPLRSNDGFGQFGLRADYELSPAVTLTSITSYEHMKVNKLSDGPGVSTPADAEFYGQAGHIDTVGQEVRLLGTTGPAIWTVGSDFDNSTIVDEEIETAYVTNDQPVSSLAPYHYTNAIMHQRVYDYAIFGNVDYTFFDNFVAHAGLRATQSLRSANSCVFDPYAATDGNPVENIFEYLENYYASIGVKTSPYVPIPPGGCVVLSAAPQIDPGRVYNRLNEGNLSYHLGLDYKMNNGGLLYVSDSLGYKSGIITPIEATTAGQERPATQERLHAYEIGVKTPLFGRRVQLDVAAFYYQYTNQQVRSRYADPTFGLLSTTLNVPHSEETGIDVTLQAHPFTGLDLSVGGTYISSEVTSPYIATNGANVTGDFKGSQLPYDAKVTLIGDGQYTWPVLSTVNAFAGFSFTYHDVSNATFNDAADPAPAFKLPAYLVVNIRAGVASANGAWRLTAFVQNVGNKYYWYNVSTTPDTVVRYAALPRVYGVSLSYRLH